MSKIILILGAVIIIALGAVFVLQPSDSSDVGGGREVVYSNDGFSPKELTIKKGDTVTFRNESSRVTWPATAIHPSHKAYPGSDIRKCLDDELNKDIFDSCGDVQPSEEWSFQFQEVGTWRYHDHRRVSETATIIVEE